MVSLGEEIIVSCRSLDSLESRISPIGNELMDEAITTFLATGTVETVGEKHGKADLCCP